MESRPPVILVVGAIQSEKQSAWTCPGTLPLPQMPATSRGATSTAVNRTPDLSNDYILQPKNVDYRHRRTLPRGAFNASGKVRCVRRRVFRTSVFMPRSCNSCLLTPNMEQLSAVCLSPPPAHHAFGHVEQPSASPTSFSPSPSNRHESTMPLLIA